MLHADWCVLYYWNEIALYELSFVHLSILIAFYELLTPPYSKHQDRTDVKVCIFYIQIIKGILPILSPKQFLVVILPFDQNWKIFTLGQNI